MIGKIGAKLHDEEGNLKVLKKENLIEAWQSTKVVSGRLLNSTKDIYHRLISKDDDDFDETLFNKENNNQ